MPAHVAALWSPKSFAFFLPFSASALLSALSFKLHSVPGCDWWALPGGVSIAIAIALVVSHFSRLRRWGSAPAADKLGLIAVASVLLSALPNAGDILHSFVRQSWPEPSGWTLSDAIGWSGAFIGVLFASWAFKLSLDAGSSPSSLGCWLMARSASPEIACPDSDWAWGANPHGQPWANLHS